MSKGGPYDPYASKGDMYAWKMEDALKLMYKRGAIGGEDCVTDAELGEALGMPRDPVVHAMQLLRERGLVEMPEPGLYRLTGPGFDEGRRLSRAGEEQGKPY